jgi:hypothetical protein
MRYKNFQNFIIRTPLSSLDNLNNNIDLESFKNKNKLLQAIRLAAPALYQEYKKWLSFGFKNKKDEERLLYSMNKYFTRSCMRCTPFGLFAGLALGKIGDTNSVILQTPEYHKPHTRLDMHFLNALINKLDQKSVIREQLSYSINNSAYAIEDKLRYIEYSFTKGVRKHKVVGTSLNIYLQKVLNSGMSTFYVTFFLSP